MLATRLLAILLVMTVFGCAQQSRRPVHVSPTKDLKVDCYESLKELLAIPAVDASDTLPFSHNALSNREDTLRIPTSRDFAGDSPSYWLHLNKEKGIAFVTRTGGIGGNLNATYGPWSIDEPKVKQLIQRLATSAAP